MSDSIDLAALRTLAIKALGKPPGPPATDSDRIAYVSAVMDAAPALIRLVGAALAVSKHRPCGGGSCCESVLDALQEAVTPFLPKEENPDER